MELDVIISQQAKRDIEYFAAYLSERWSESVKMDFLVDLTEQIEVIAQMPNMYRKSKKGKNLRECIVNKQTIMYYQINQSNIEIVTIRSSKQNPKKLKF
jgi:plasmid stabilization system protein ParE